MSILQTGGLSLLKTKCLSQVCTNAEKAHCLLDSKISAMQFIHPFTRLSFNDCLCNEKQGSESCLHRTIPNPHVASLPAAPQ